jgi:hypothetical protein
MRRFLPPFNRPATNTNRRRTRRRHDPASGPRRLRLESLEDRRVLATFMVSNTNDDGLGSLRNAIAQANANDNSPAVVDVIDFSSLFSTPQTILLTSGELSITESLTISGPGADLLTIDASGNDLTPLVKDGAGSRVFNIDDGGFDLINVTLDGLTITGGDIGGFDVDINGDHFLIENGGGIKSFENLTILNSIVENNAIVADLTADELEPDYNSSNSRIEGGGIHFEGGSLIVSNSVIRNNLLKANYQGGVIGSAAVLAEAYGAGISAFAPTSVTIENSIVSGNESIADITNVRSDQLPDNDARGMSVLIKGGGVSASGFGELTITESWVRGNSAQVVGDFVSADGNDNTVAIEGAGIYSSIPSLIENSTISENTGIYDLEFLPGTMWLDMYSQGGGAWLSGSTIVSSTFSGNSLMTRLLDDENFTVIATFDRQVRSWGAGLYMSGNSRVEHSTIADNHLVSETDNMAIAHAGAGLWSDGNFPPNSIEAVVNHSLIADNTIQELFRRDPELPNDDDLFISEQDISTRPIGLGGVVPDPDEITIVYSLIETYDVIFSAASGNNVLDVDPLLGPLQNNGGFTLPDGSRILTHALLPDSPAIDAGDSTLVAGVGDTPEFDQRGAPFDRVIDAPGTPQTGAIIDIGAFEYGYSADADGDGIVDGADFLAWQRGFGTTSGATREDGDFDGDGDVDSHDLDIWRAMFGSTPSPVNNVMVLAPAPNFRSEAQQTSEPLDSAPQFANAAEPTPATTVAAFEAALAGLIYPRIEQLPRTPYSPPARHVDDAVRTSAKIEPTLPSRRWSTSAAGLLDDSTILHHDESPVDWFDDAFELL